MILLAAYNHNTKEWLQNPLFSKACTIVGVDPTGIEVVFGFKEKIKSIESEIFAGDILIVKHSPVGSIRTITTKVKIVWSNHGLRVCYHLPA